MKRVISHQTEDGRLFTDKCEALTHETFLKLRGLIGSTKASKDPTLPDGAIDNLSRIIVANAEAYYTLLQKYKEKMRRANCKVEVDSGE
jgi:dsDNA-binding SOS-regulon protein